MGFAGQTTRGNKQNKNPIKGTQTLLQSLFFCWVHTLSRTQFQGLTSHYSESHTSIIILMHLPHNKRGMAESIIATKLLRHIPHYIEKSKPYILINKYN